MIYANLLARTFVVTACLSIANDRMRGAALEMEYEDALRRRYDLRTCARPWRCLRQRTRSVGTWTALLYGFYQS